MFRTHDHPQGVYVVPCKSYHLKHSVHYFVMLTLVLWQHNFSKEQCILPQDDRVIETCRSVLNVLM